AGVEAIPPADYVAPQVNRFLEKSAQRRQRLIGNVDEVRRFRPRHRVRSLHDQKRIWEVVLVESSAGADKDLIMGRAGILVAPQPQLIALGDFRQQRLVVWAVPRLVQVKLTEEVLMFEKRKQQYAPAVEWLAVFV